MTVYQSLCSGYNKWRQSHLDHRHLVRQFMAQFRVHFCEYLGIPEKYEEAFTDKPRPYVYLQHATENEDGSITYSKPENVFDEITRDRTGYWITGLVVVMEIAPNAYPKDPFRFSIRFAARDKDVEMYVDPESKIRFDLKIDDPSSFEAAYKAMVQMFNKAFEGRPWAETDGVQIGFTAPREG